MNILEHICAGGCILTWIRCKIMHVFFQVSVDNDLILNMFFAYPQLSRYCMSY